MKMVRHQCPNINVHWAFLYYSGQEADEVVPIQYTSLLCGSWYKIVSASSFDSFCISFYSHKFIDVSSTVAILPVLQSKRTSFLQRENGENNRGRNIGCRQPHICANLNNKFSKMQISRFFYRGVTEWQTCRIVTPVGHRSVLVRIPQPEAIQFHFFGCFQGMELIYLEQFLLIYQTIII